MKRRASGVFTSPSHRAYFTHLCRKLHDSTYLIRLFQLKHLPLCLAYSRLPGNVLFMLICCEKGLRKKTEEICPLTSNFLKSLFYYFPYRWSLLSCWNNLSFSFWVSKMKWFLLKLHFQVVLRIKSDNLNGIAMLCPLPSTHLVK